IVRVSPDLAIVKLALSHANGEPLICNARLAQSPVLLLHFRYASVLLAPLYNLSLPKLLKAGRTLGTLTRYPLLPCFRMRVFDCLGLGPALFVRENDLAIRADAFVDRRRHCAGRSHR